MTPQRPCRLCGAEPTRPYMQGPLCASCAPPAPPVPDPSRTAAALRDTRVRQLRALHRKANAA